MSCTKVINVEHIYKTNDQFNKISRFEPMNIFVFLKYLYSECSGYPYFTEIQWLSCSDVLERFYKLKDAIKIIVVSKIQDIALVYWIYSNYKVYPS